RRCERAIPWGWWQAGIRVPRMLASCTRPIPSVPRLARRSPVSSCCRRSGCSARLWLELASTPKPHRGEGSTEPRRFGAETVGLPAMVLAVSGFVALVYEVTWTRVLAMTLGPTTYAFSAMLVAFIAGLAIGSAIAARVAHRARRPGVWLGIAMIAAAAAALLASARVDQLPLTVAAAAG